MEKIMSSAEKTIFGLKKYQFFIFLSISVIWLIGCFACLFPFPQVRNLIIELAAFILGRPLRNLNYWHSFIKTYTVIGIFTYIVFFLLFFLNDYLSHFLDGKRTGKILILASSFFVFLIMFRANWTFSDDHIFISTTAINKYAPFLILPSLGRFWPLGYTHYNFPLFLFQRMGINTGLPVEVHLMVISIFFVVTFFCLYLLFSKIEPLEYKKYPAFTLFFACTFFILGGNFVFVYLYLIFAETPIIMLFSVFMLMYYKALKTDKLKYYAVAVIAAMYSTYCKEPVFGVFLVIAIINIIFHYKESSKRERIFYIILIANAAIFIFMYYFFVFQNASGFYNQGRVSSGRFKMALLVFLNDPILVVMFLFGFLRLFFILGGKQRECLYYDSLLFAGISYVFAYFILRLEAGYYYAPAVILFLPSLVYWVKNTYGKKRIYALCFLIILMPIYAYNTFNTVRRIENTWHDRQEFMPLIRDLLSRYNNNENFLWYESDNMVTGDTFYKATREWRRAVLHRFLNYENKSEEMDFFIVTKDLSFISMENNIMFFYPIDNDQFQPMPDDLAVQLLENNFVLYKDYGGVLISGGIIPRRSAAVRRN